jgi:hypothetical protein
MSFGLRALKVQREDATVLKKTYVDHLIIGDDGYAILTLLKLIHKYPDQSFALVTELPLRKEDIKDMWKYNLHFIRTLEGAELLKEHHPHLTIEASNTKTYFYKDTKFHEFGGRAKPMELKKGENFFVSPYFQFDYDQLMSADEWNNLDETLLKYQKNKIIEKIEMTEPSDLVEKTHFKMYFADNTEFHCENLYWGLSPKKFLSLVSNKDKLDEVVSEYAMKYEEQAGIVIHFHCNKVIYPEMCTLFLPQSVTHEEGHYIGEVMSPHSGEQEANFLILLQEEEDLSEEALAKKIRHLKRVMERVLPEFSSTRYTERIRYSTNVLVSTLETTKLAQMNEHHSTLHFIGKVASKVGFKQEEAAIHSIFRY